MRIFINMPDETGTSKTTRISIMNCTDTTQLIRQITKQLNINKNGFIFTLKNQIINLRIIDDWPLTIYAIKNGSWIYLQKNLIIQKKQSTCSSTTSLQRIEENQQNLSGQVSRSFDSSEKIISFFSHKSEDYSDYYDQQLAKMLIYTRDNQLLQIATLLKQQPDIEDQVLRQQIMEEKNKYCLNQTGECGRSALHWAIHNGNSQIVTFLLMKFADPTVQTIDQYTPLQLAVIHRNLDIINLLILQPKVDINTLTSHGTALHVACYHHSICLIKILLQNGANPDILNKDNKKAVSLNENKQIKILFQDYQKKQKLRLLKPNITKGNVLKISSSLTYRTKQRILMVNPFRGDIVFYKQKDIVDHRMSIKSIIKVETIQQKSWLMDDKINYFRIIYQNDNQQSKIIIGIKHVQLVVKWMNSIDLARTYVNNQKYVSKIDSQLQLIELLDDVKNQIKVHKRQLVDSKKKDSPTKSRYSIINMKIKTQAEQLKQAQQIKQTQQNAQKVSPKKYKSRQTQSYQDVYQKSFFSSNDGGDLRQSEILLGSIVGQKGFDSPTYKESSRTIDTANTWSRNTVNIVTFPQEDKLSPILDPTKSAPSNFRKKSFDISTVIHQFKLQDKKIQKPKVSFNDFQFKKLLGSGAFGQVYLAKSKKNEKLYAMKVLNKKRLMAKKHLKYAVSETNILKRVQHPFIISLHYSFQTPTNLYLALDYCPFGDLSQILCEKQRFTETTAKFLIAQAILSIQYLHQLKIIYRDLKPENILIGSDGYIKLIDFGLSKQNHFATSFCGSPAYLSPEMLDKKGHSFPTDIYGLGCVLYEMVIGEPPFYDQNMEQMFDNIKNGRLKYPGYLTKQLKSLIGRMLQRDASKRIASKQLRQHQFFKAMSWEKILKKNMSAPKQIFPQAEEDDEIKLQKNNENQVLKYADQQYTQTSMFNKIKGFSFSRD